MSVDAGAIQAESPVDPGSFTIEPEGGQAAPSAAPSPSGGGEDRSTWIPPQHYQDLQRQAQEYQTRLRDYETLGAPEELKQAREYQRRILAAAGQRTPTDEDREIAQINQALRRVAPWTEHGAKLMTPDNAAKLERLLQFADAMPALPHIARAARVAEESAIEAAEETVRLKAEEAGLDPDSVFYIEQATAGYIRRNPELHAQYNAAGAKGKAKIAGEASTAVLQALFKTNARTAAAATQADAERRRQGLPKAPVRGVAAGSEAELEAPKDFRAAAEAMFDEVNRMRDQE